MNKLTDAATVYKFRTEITWGKTVEWFIDHNSFLNLSLAIQFFPAKKFKKIVSTSVMSAKI